MLLAVKKISSNAMYLFIKLLMKNIGNLFARLFVVSLLAFRYFSTIVSPFGAGAVFLRLRLRLRLRTYHFSGSDSGSGSDQNESAPAAPTPAPAPAPHPWFKSFRTMLNYATVDELSATLHM